MQWITNKAKCREIVTPEPYLWLPKMPPMKKDYKVTFIHNVSKVEDIPTDCDTSLYVTSKDITFYQYYERFKNVIDDFLIYNVGEWLVLEVSVKKGKGPKIE